MFWHQAASSSPEMALVNNPSACGKQMTAGIFATKKPPIFLGGFDMWQD